MFNKIKNFINILLKRKKAPTIDLAIEGMSDLITKFEALSFVISALKIRDDLRNKDISMYGNRAHYALESLRDELLIEAKKFKNSEANVVTRNKNTGIEVETVAYSKELSKLERELQEKLNGHS